MNVQVTITVGQRWLAWISRRTYEQGVLAFLPSTDQEIRWAQAWLTLQDASRTTDELAEVVSEFRDEERVLLRRLRPDLPVPLLDSATAVVDGLRVAMCLRHRPLDVASARAELTDRLTVWSASDSPPDR